MKWLSDVVINKHINILFLIIMQDQKDLAQELFYEVIKIHKITCQAIANECYSMKPLGKLQSWFNIYPKKQFLSTY